jgi:mono/diheme cytochrome c family protein
MLRKYAPVLMVLAGLALGRANLVARAQQPSSPQPSAQQQAVPGQAAQNAQSQVTHPYTPTATDAARTNPMKFTEKSVDRGKRVYTTQCAMCHGDTGLGNGDLAKDMGAKPPDFTSPATLKDRTDGELFAIIGVGSGLMPGQGERMKDYHKWDVINYLRFLSGRVPAKSSSDEFDPDHPTVLEQQPPKH